MLQGMAGRPGLRGPQAPPLPGHNASKAPARAHSGSSPGGRLSTRPHRPSQPPAALRAQPSAPPLQRLGMRLQAPAVPLPTAQSRGHCVTAAHQRPARTGIRWRPRRLCGAAWLRRKLC